MTPTRPAVHPFHDPVTGTWSYVVADPATGQAAIVDPVLDFDAASGRTATGSAERLLACVREHGGRVAWLLETHAHADHLTAAHWLKTHHFRDARVAIGQGIVRVQKTFRPIFNLGERFPVDGSQFDHLFADGERFVIGGIDALAISVPGHTPDSLAFLIGEALFAGDTLFMPDAGTARCDFPGGDAAQLYRSIQRLYALPEDTRVFVCHDYGRNGGEVRCETTLGEHKRANVHVRDGVSEAEFVALRTRRDATLATPALLLPAIQVNIRAGALPEPEDNGVRYLKLPVDRL